MTELSPAQKAAFDLVRSVAEDWLTEGRRAYGASLKPELQKRTLGSFNEVSLGFTSFKHFLLAAESQGLVELHPAPRGPDLQVVPKGREPLPIDTPTRDAVPLGARPGVREDLWSAWIDWNPGVVRYYDRGHDRAHRLPSYESPLDSDEIKALRSEIAASPERFIEIAPVTFDEQVAWMKEFADQQPAGIRAQLMSALESPRPARDFTAAVRERQHAAQMWAAERVRRVTERIKQFQKEHDVEFPIVRPERSPAGDASGSDSREVEGRALAIDADTLRSRLHKAIDDMPVADLLSLKIPLGHLFEVRQ